MTAQRKVVNLTTDCRYSPIKPVSLEMKYVFVLVDRCLLTRSFGAFKYRNIIRFRGGPCYDPFVRGKFSENLVNIFSLSW